MEIAVIHPGFTGALGGAKAVSYQIASALQEDYSVTHFTEEVLSPERVEERFSIDNYNDVEAKRVEKPSDLKIFERVPRFALPTEARRSRPYCKLFNEIKDDYDLVFFTSHLFDLEQYSGENVGEINQNTIIYHHSGPIDSDEIDDRNFLYRKIINNGQIKQLKSKRNLFNSDYSLSQTFKDGEVVYPPVSEKFTFNSDTEKRIVYLGRISPEKRMEDALEISEETGIPLTVVGYKQDESYFEDLESRSSEDVEFITDASRDEIRSILERCRYGLNCGKYSEMFGIVTIEYMKSGTIPVVRNVTSNKETVQRETLRWESIEEASDIIDSLEDGREPELEYIKKRKDDFGTSKFRKEIRKTVEELI